MAITGRLDITQNMAKGLGFFQEYLSIAPGAGTIAAALASGSVTVQLYFNNVGTTLPGTLVGFPLPPAPPSGLLMTRAQMNNSQGSCALILVRLYKIGTLVLTATGDQFTHDAATFPVLRTQFGEASKPLSLLPIVYLSTATATTAPIISFQTAAGAAGYTNQAGTSVIGTASNFTFPNVATTINSAFIYRLNTGDSGVQNINQIRVHTAGTTGAAIIFGAEILGSFVQVSDQTPYVIDTLFGGLAPVDLKPAAATSGTATSYLAVMGLSITASGMSISPCIAGVLNV